LADEGARNLLDTPLVLAFAADRCAAGERVALIAVTAVTGASVRNPGALMAITESGAFAGSLSGGCIESAVVAEARMALEAGNPRRLRYGAGSPVIDIRLPCGGAVDLLVEPRVPSALPGALLARLAERHAAGLRLGGMGGAVTDAAIDATNETADGFAIRILPLPRLIAIGQGATLSALARLSRATAVDFLALTPDATLAPALQEEGFAVHRLYSHGHTDPVIGDPWAAFAFFFHEHEWEVRLLAAALAQPSLYVGAMGSRATHAVRVASLRAAGVGDDDIARIRAPIGIIPSSRDPETLALSTLTEVIDAYNRSS
jgi:xanthine dehydrogenase accessory factor